MLAATRAITAAPGAGLSSSTSATASCRRRRPSTSQRSSPRARWLRKKNRDTKTPRHQGEFSRARAQNESLVLLVSWWSTLSLAEESSAASDEPDRGRPVQSRRAGPAGGGSTVPVQPVQRPRHHRPAAAAALAGRAADLRPPRRRARAIYDKIGGCSPLLANTEAQARALEAALGADHRCFIAMRYWHPFSERRARGRGMGPDRIVLLPLYPQFSTTTTESSLAEWHRAARRAGLSRRRRRCAAIRASPASSPRSPRSIRERWRSSPAGIARRVLFSAHGLPKKIVRARRSLSVAGRGDRRRACAPRSPCRRSTA